jgi:hypothetical protein
LTFKPRNRNDTGGAGVTREPGNVGAQIPLGHAVKFVPDPGVDRLSKGRYTIVRKLIEER